jgi:hypothetical protein
MNCNNCGTSQKIKPVQTCCEMTGALITIQMGYCTCKDDNDDNDDLSGRMIDHGERPTITIDPSDATQGLLRKVAGLKRLQRIGRSIGIENTVGVDVKDPADAKRIGRVWFT